jgi:hypothetical protein
MGSGVPQPPHFAAEAVKGTRFRRPHVGHGRMTPAESICRDMVQAYRFHGIGGPLRHGPPGESPPEDAA